MILKAFLAKPSTLESLAQPMPERGPQTSLFRDCNQTLTTVEFGTCPDEQGIEKPALWRYK